MATLDRFLLSPNETENKLSSPRLGKLSKIEEKNNVQKVEDEMTLDRALKTDANQASVHRTGCALYDC